MNGSVQQTQMTQMSNATEHTGSGYYVIPKETVQLIKTLTFYGIIPVLVLVGLVLNTLCCIMFYKLKTITSTVVLLFSLAITDNIILLVAAMNSLSTASSYYQIPFTIQQRIQVIPYFDTYFNAIPARIGNTITLLISLERLFCVLQPMKIKQYSSKKYGIIAVAFVYIFTSTMCLPLLFIYQTKEIYSNKTASFVSIIQPTELGRNEAFSDSFYVTMATLFKLVPVFGVMLSSTITGGVVLTSARRRVKMTTSSQVTSNQKEMQVTRTLLFLTFSFFVCQLPTGILMIIIFIGMTPYKYTSNIFEVAMSVGYIPQVVNSCINFIIYYKTGEVYRNEIKSLFCRKDEPTKINGT